MFDVGSVNTFEVGLGEVVLATVQEEAFMPSDYATFPQEICPTIRGKDWIENDAWMEGRLLPRCTTWRRRGVLNKGRGEEEHCRRKHLSVDLRLHVWHFAEHLAVQNLSLTRSYKTGGQRTSSSMAERRQYLMTLLLAFVKT
jgi:hypothetical protein